MNNVTRLVILSLCAALILGSCTKKHHQPEEPLKAPLDFTAVSQNSALKSGATKATTPLSEVYSDFGAWGIARQEGNATPYILWESNAMSQVVKSTDNTYVPVVDAYWLTGFAYNFIAVAPYTEGVSGVAVAHSVDTQTGKDAITFTFDQGAKYTAGDFDFDLMGAAASTAAITTKPTTQPLTFWHLFSQICINVIFEAADKTPIEGTVNAIRLSNVVTKADYTISFDPNDNLNVVCAPSSSDSDKLSSSAPILLNQSNKNQGSDQKWTLHIFPQSVSGFDMYIDFTIGETHTTNFKVNLTAAGNETYVYNGAYIWNIRISPKSVSFDVSVNSWIDDNSGNNEFGFE